MTEIGLGHYLTLGAVIFSIGVIGIFLNRKNIIVILMSIELILLAVNINLVSFSIYLGDLTGQVAYTGSGMYSSVRGVHAGGYPSTNAIIGIFICSILSK